MSKQWRSNEEWLEGIRNDFRALDRANRWGACMQMRREISMSEFAYRMIETVACEVDEEELEAELRSNRKVKATAAAMIARASAR